MSREMNVKLEADVAAALIRDLPELHGLTLASQAAPGPDLLGILVNRKLGVEVTSLHGVRGEHGSTEMRNRVATSEFFYRVERHVLELGAPCVLNITLFGEVTGGMERARGLAQEIIELVESSLRAHQLLELSRLQRPRGLPPELVRLDVRWPPDFRRPLVLLSGPSFLVRSNFADALQSAIDDKARRIDTYRQYCDECWLAVVLPHYFEIEDTDGSKPVLDYRFRAPFDRVVVLDHTLEH